MTLYVTQWGLHSSPPKRLPYVESPKGLLSESMKLSLCYRTSTLAFQVPTEDWLWKKENANFLERLERLRVEVRDPFLDRLGQLRRAYVDPYKKLETPEGQPGPMRSFSLDFLASEHPIEEVKLFGDIAEAFRLDRGFFNFIVKGAVKVALTVCPADVVTSVNQEELLRLLNLEGSC